MPLSNCEVGGGIAPIPELLAMNTTVALGSDGYINDMFSIMETQNKSKKTNTHIGEALNMTSEEKKISFYNRYFIFKKERDVGNVTIAKTKKTKINIKPKNIKKLTDRIIIKYS